MLKHSMPGTIKTSFGVCLNHQRQVRGQQGLRGRSHNTRHATRCATGQSRAMREVSASLRIARRRDGIRYATQRSVASGPERHVTRSRDQSLPSIEGGNWQNTMPGILDHDI
jgi:hypothetical protein